MKKFEDYLCSRPRRLYFSTNPNVEIHPIAALVIVCSGLFVAVPIAGGLIVLLFP
jgi:hypothetical protein